MNSFQNKENLNTNVFRDDESNLATGIGVKKARYNSNQPEFEKVIVKKSYEAQMPTHIKPSSKLRTASQSKTNLNFNPSEEKFQNIKFIKSLSNQNESNFISGNIESKDFMINLQESRSRDSRSKSSSSAEDNCAQIYQMEKQLTEKALQESQKPRFKSKGRSLKHIQKAKKNIKPLTEIHDFDQFMSNSSVVNSRLTSAVARPQLHEQPLSNKENERKFLSYSHIRKKKSNLLDKPKTLFCKEEGRDLVGLTCFNTKRNASNALKQSTGFVNMTKMSFASLRTKNAGVRPDSIQGGFISSVSATTPYETYNSVKKEKNQVVITLNCSKAIPVPGYQQICNMMKPYKNQLQPQIRRSEVNNSDITTLNYLQRQNQLDQTMFSNQRLQGLEQSQKGLKMDSQDDTYDKGLSKVHINTMSAQSIQIPVAQGLKKQVDTNDDKSQLQKPFERKQRPKSSYIPQKLSHSRLRNIEDSKSMISGVASVTSKNLHAPTKSMILTGQHLPIGRNQQIRQDFTQSSKHERSQSEISKLVDAPITGLPDPEFGFKAQRGNLPDIDPQELKQLHNMIQSGTQFEFQPKQRPRTGIIKNAVSQNQVSDNMSRNQSGSSQGGNRNRFGFRTSAARLLSPPFRDQKSQGTIQGVAKSYLSKSSINQFETLINSKKNLKSPEDLSDIHSNISDEKNRQSLHSLIQLNEAKLKRVMDCNQKLLNSDDLYAHEEQWNESDRIVEGDEHGQFTEIERFQGVSEANKLMQRQFPTDQISKEQKLFNRAVKHFEDSQSKTDIALEEVEKKSNLNLIHFHIEAFDNQIAMNKIDPKSEDIDDIQCNIKMLENISEYEDDQEGVQSGNQTPVKVTKLNNFEKARMNSSMKINQLSVITDMPERNQIYKGKDKLSGQVSRTGFRGFTTNEEIDVDLMDQSPDIKRFNKRKTLIMDYMKRALSDKMMGFAIEPKAMGSARDGQLSTNRFGSSIMRPNFQGIDPKQNREQLQRRTILRTREIDDQVQDYLSMDMDEFKLLKYKESGVAYTQLMKVARPVFSGSVDPIINKFNYKKIKQKMQLSPDQITETEIKLIEQYINLKKQLDSKKLMTAIWSITPTSGTTPCSREGAAGAIIYDRFYIFGGFANDIYTDFKYLDMCSNKWEVIEAGQPSHELPQARFSHSLNQYKDQYLVMFGGAGTYLKSIKMRLCLNDVQIYDIAANRWTKIPDQPLTPKARMSHVAQIYGSLLLTHGGYSTEGKITLSDYNLFDLEEKSWIKCEVQKAGGPDSPGIGERSSHTMQAVYDADLYDRINLNERVNNRSLKNRRMLTHSRQMLYESYQDGPVAALFIKKLREQIKYDAGLYIFGGQDSHGKFYNDLWILEPDYAKNQETLGANNLHYRSEKKMSFILSQVTDYKGRPPCPRISASSQVIKTPDDEVLLVIYGGRNDQIFPVIGNVALNDICIFNVNFKTWTSLAIFGMQPCSRWSTIMLPNRKHQPDGILVFGGVNLNNYCTSRLYQLQVVNFGKKLPHEEQKPFFDDKPDLENEAPNQHQTQKLKDRRGSSQSRIGLKSKKSSSMTLPPGKAMKPTSNLQIVEDFERAEESVINADVDGYHQHKLDFLQETVKEKIEVIKEIIKNYNDGNEK